MVLELQHKENVILFAENHLEVYSSMDKFVLIVMPHVKIMDVLELPLIALTVILNI